MFIVEVLLKNILINMKVRLITSLEETGNLSSETKLYISQEKNIAVNKDRFYLAYYINMADTINEDDNYSNLAEEKITLNQNDENKIIRCSELIQKLINYDWLIPKRLLIDDMKIKEGDFDVIKVIKREESLSPLYTIQVPVQNVEDSNDYMYVTKPDSLTDSIFEEQWEFIFSDIPNGENIKKQIENMASNEEIYLYNTSKKEFDLLGNDSNSINLINFDSDIYTNLVDIKSIINRLVLSKDTSAKVDLSIQYSIGSDIYNFDTTFSGFSINNKVIKFNNFIQNVNDSIMIEITNGVIRLFPINESIKECIISNCVVTYGNLRQL